MATLNIETTPVISTNRTRINLYKESSPLATIQTLTHDAPHVANETWAFFNLLPSENYRYKWIEIDAAGLTLQQYASQWFTTPTNATFQIKTTGYLTVGITPGITAGTTVAIFDGTNGTQDYRGWNITVDKPGFGDQFPTENYTWNSTTGTFTSVNPFEAGEKFTFQFDPKIGTAPSVNTPEIYTGSLVVTSNTILTLADLKKLIIIEGSGSYLTLTFPDITTIPERQEITIISGIGSHKCANIIFNANSLKWLKGNRSNLYICPNESVKIVRDGSVFRVITSDGNFKNVGEIVSDDAATNNVFNKVILNGQEGDILDYARIYNDYISLLSTTVLYADWNADKTKFSLANDTGKFMFPDRRDMFERATDGILRAAGTYQADDIKLHTHRVGTTGNQAGVDPGRALQRSSTAHDPYVYFGAGVDPYIQETGGEDTRPKNYSTNKYVLV